MERKLIVRGVLAGAIAGLLAYAFSRIFAEPVITQAINYESGRDAVIAAIDAANAHDPNSIEIDGRFRLPDKERDVMLRELAQWEQDISVDEGVPPSHYYSDAFVADRQEMAPEALRSYLRCLKREPAHF